MNQLAESSKGLQHRELLRALKRNYSAQGNRSPFAADRVVRHTTAVDELDVPAIHQEVRQALTDKLQRMRQGQQSEVVLLAGDPGMGKSHLLNWFRNAARAQELGYILVAPSNSWKVQEFGECLLDNLVAALVPQGPMEPHLLLEKVQDIAFQALDHLLSRQGQIHTYVARRGWRWWKFLGRLFRGTQARFRKAVDARDETIFPELDFARFADYVCSRFLPAESKGNPFHRTVLRMLLAYLFPPYREAVLHWLRGKEVRLPFKLLGVDEKIDKTYKVMDAVKILISLFTRDVEQGLETPSPGRVFFFAFDQMEGRNELFEQDDDWFTFFAQLSELHGTLPNVLILFTMTTGLRDRLFRPMEKQFKDRISRDPRFMLTRVQDAEVLELYKRRLACWMKRGQEAAACQEILESNDACYAPFTTQELLALAGQRPLRGVLDEFDLRFGNFMLEEITDQDPDFEFNFAVKEFRKDKEQISAFQATEGHFEVVKELFSRHGEMLAMRYQLVFSRIEEWPTEDEVPALRFEFRHPAQTDNWFRVFLVRLPYMYNAKLEGACNLLKGLNKGSYHLWLLRPTRIEKAWEERRPDQIFARKLELDAHVIVHALRHVLDKRGQFDPRSWKNAEELVHEQVKLTYIGEMLHLAAEALDTLPSPKAAS